MTHERRASAAGLLLGAASSVQIGAAVAKSLFPQLGPAGVVFLRLVFGSAALWAIARPELRGRERHDLRLVVALGVVLVSMNISFYEALSRAPLGIAVTVEFLGPLALAIYGSRRALDVVWVVLAGTGVALLADTRGPTHVSGIILAATAGLFWALYSLLGIRVGRRWPGPSGLAPAMVIGAILIAPWGIYSAGDGLRDPQLIGATVGVGLLSSALPWSLEIEAMRRIPPQVYGVLMSIEPAIAALAGLLFLHEHLHTRAWIAIALVIAASAGATGRRRPPTPATPPA